jgi:hypothetical protein
MTAYETAVIDRAQSLDIPPVGPAEEHCDVCGRPETHDNLLMICVECLQQRCQRCSTRAERRAMLCREHLPPEVGELIFALETAKADAKRLLRMEGLSSAMQAMAVWRVKRLAGMGI